MIHHLRGSLVDSMPGSAVVDVHGVGYQVLIPLSTFEKLPLPPAEVKLLTVFVVREDSQLLFGFLTREERDLFTLLVDHVSGVGPKMALNVLNGCSTHQFKLALLNQDHNLLSRIKGVGKKTAERIVMELKDKVGLADAWQAMAQSGGTPTDQKVLNDALLALLALGYKQQDALKVLQASTDRSSVETLVREALKKLNA
jgi:Holliday junction DNA helicase RuvA